MTTLHEVPLPGQNVCSLATLTPGVTGSAVTSGDDYTNEYSIRINAGGLRQEQNGFLIDDAFTNTSSRGGATSSSPNAKIVDSMTIRRTLSTRRRAATAARLSTSSPSPAPITCTTRSTTIA